MQGLMGRFSMMVFVAACTVVSGSRDQGVRQVIISDGGDVTGASDLDSAGNLDKLSEHESNEDADATSEVISDGGDLTSASDLDSAGNLDKLSELENDEAADATSYLVTSKGECSDDDLERMAAMGHGDSAVGKFPEAGGSCGKQSVKIGFGLKWLHEKFKACLNEKVKENKQGRNAGQGLSDGCLSCYSNSGANGLANCKGPCMGGWYTSSCIDCNADYSSTTLKDCVGRPEPAFKPGPPPEPESLQQIEEHESNEDADATSEVIISDGGDLTSASDLDSAGNLDKLSELENDEGADATSYLVTSKGECSDDDLERMAAMGHGDSAVGKFPEAGGSCGKQSVKIGFGLKWLHEKFKACLNEKVKENEQGRNAGQGLSDGCLSCYSNSGANGLANCKGPCMGGWYTSSCIDCNADYSSTTLKDCVGRPEPAFKPGPPPDQ